MVKHIQTIRRHSTNCLSVFDHFVGLELKGFNSLDLKFEIQNLVTIPKNTKIETEFVQCVC